MKTVTLDWETYVKELQLAKESGFNLLPNLKMELNRLFKSLDKYDQTEYYEARKNLLNMIRELEDVSTFTKS